MANELRARLFDADDADTVTQWGAFHGRPIDPRVFPPHGVIVEDANGAAAAVFAHLSVGHGTCIIDHAITRPMLHVAESRRVLDFALSAIIAAAHDQGDGYRLFRIFAHPAIARHLRKSGWTEDGECVAMSLLVP